MTSTGNQPDWDTIAEKFDYWLPHIAPVGKALIDALDAATGQQILDVASGTGEPAISLARKLNDTAHIIGTDSAQGMVNAAQNKLAKLSLHNIEFRCQTAEKLSFADYTFDRVLSRFGVMLFEDPLLGLREMHRVLKPGGRFAYSVWSTPQTMTTLRWSAQVFENKVPEDAQPPIDKITSLGQPGVLEKLMDDAGYQHYEARAHTFHYEFASFDEYWEILEASDILKAQFDALPNDQRHLVRDELALLADEFQTSRGLIIPHEYLLVSGAKT